MLVLTRGRDDKVLFPSLGISIDILRIAGNKVRLGIEAPKEIPVLRHELAQQGGDFRETSASRRVPQLSHELRNRLHTAVLELYILHGKIESGENDDAEETIFKIFSELKTIEEELNPSASRTDSLEVGCKFPRTLLVEDDANERELLASYLRLNGLEVDTAMDGLQAMVYLSRHEPPDVVLMDMRMPRFDGRKAVTAIRANPAYRGLKIFAVSGTEQSELPVGRNQGGVDRWFTKPVNPQELVSAIQREVACGSISA